MLHNQSSNNSSSHEEKIICPNCMTNLLWINENKSRRMINTIYNFNKDNFTCRACGKIIHDQEITTSIKSMLNLNI
jgi:RNase P subunit RPR2